MALGMAMAISTLSATVVQASTTQSTTSTSSLASQGTLWKQVDVGGSHSCGIQNDGTLWCWGYNSDGELGVGDTFPRTSPTQVGAASDWLSVTVGELHTCGIRKGSGSQDGVLTKGGMMWCWGANADGQLGVGDTSQRTTPSRVGSLAGWTSASAGGAHTCGLRVDQTLWCWGENGDGQLGIGDLVNRLTPVEVATDSWSSISTGAAHTCGIETTAEGTLWCWGGNEDGQLGVGDTTDRLRPTQVSPGSTWLRVENGGAHTCAIESTGFLWCWGYNLHGQLGLGDTDQRNSPSQVGSSGDWVTIGGGNLHTCAIQSDHSLWCWGWNRFGQLGTGDLKNWVVPVQIEAPATSWKTVSGGDFHSCGLGKHQALWCWGFNGSGQLGLGDTATRLVPTQV